MEPNRGCRLLDELSKAICTRAQSADARRVVPEVNSEGTVPVQPVSSVRGFLTDWRVLKVLKNSLVLNEVQRVSFSGFKALQTRAQSADALEMIPRDDSEGTEFVLPVRGVRVVCSNLWNRLFEIIEEIWCTHELPFLIFTPDGFGEFLVGSAVALGRKFVDSIGVREGTSDVPCF